MENNTNNNSINENKAGEPKGEVVEVSQEQLQSKKKLIVLVVAILIVAALAIAGVSKYTKPGEFGKRIEGCGPEDQFSQTTGEPCREVEIPEPCQEGELYDRNTGEPCPAPVTPQPATPAAAQ